MSNKLIVLSGIPGSGKSTYCKYVDATDKRKVIVVSSDEIRKELTGKYANFSRDKEMWRILNDKIEFYGSREKDVIVIVDTTALSNKLRYKYVLNHGGWFDERELVVFKLPIERCIKQNYNRPQEKWVPEKNILEMKEKLEDIDYKTVYSYFTSVKIITEEDKYYDN